MSLKALACLYIHKLPISKRPIITLQLHSMRGFLDISIGDVGEHATNQASYERAEAFIAAVGTQYGWSGPVCDLSEEAQQTLLEAYAADPIYSAKGIVSVQRPKDIHAGRLVFELMTEECPKTCENMRCLLTGERGLGKASKRPLHLQGNRFHRIVKGFVCQGGDIVRGDGSGGDSIYGGKFNDEKAGLKHKHDAVGVLAMANGGKNTNTSQFYFTLGPAPACDGRHVVFGRVLEGLDILQRIDAEAASVDGTPRVDVAITACGVLL